MIVHGSTIFCVLALFTVYTPYIAYSEEATMPSTDTLDELTLTVVFDNTFYISSCGSAWGFACVIEGPERTVLFDTGSDGELLLANMRVLGIDPSAIDIVVLSHEHWDHVDGLPAFLALNNDVTVIVPQSFSEEIKTRVTRTGAKLIETYAPYQICAHVATTGELGDVIIEQGLVIDTTDGLIVITGCAHPGIVHMLRTIDNQYRHRQIRFVMGGFHLKDTPATEFQDIISDFRELNIPYAGATHCTGEEAIHLFAETYGDHYVTAGAGRIITLSELR